MAFEERICAYCKTAEDEYSIEKYPDFCPHCGEKAKWLTPQQYADIHYPGETEKEVV